MYRVLCYGDSNTWGVNPANGLRFSEMQRWPGVLRNKLGDGFEVVEDGANGRTVLGSVDSFRDSIMYGPYDVVLIFLGINDVCFEKETRIDTIISGIEHMVQLLQSGAAGSKAARPEVILMSAVPISKAQIEDGLYELEAEKVLRYGEALRDLAAGMGCGFIDSGRIIHSSSLDGIHLEAPEHEKLGLFSADYIHSFLKNSNLTI